VTLDWRHFKSAGNIGISDDQFFQELRVRRRFEQAIDAMRSAIKDVNETSTLVEIEPSAFEDFLNDECPSHEYWAEKLSRARHGFS
jgi:hypothetical protein